MADIQKLRELSASALLQELRAREMKAAGSALTVGEAPSDDLRDFEDATIVSVLKESQKVIYGVDDRVDVFELAAGRNRDDVDSVAALFQNADVIDNGNGTSTLQTQNFGGARNLCAGERFRDQPTGAFCSGFLVAPDIIATAGHCVTAATVANVRFVFGFRMRDAATAETVVSNGEIYRGLQVIDREQVGTGPDWALVRIDRPVTNHRIVRIRRTGRIGDTQALHVIGHPSGLPTKFAGGAQVRDNTDDAFFVANLDTYGGNSGSPVFNGDSHEVEGVLVRGETDFVRQGTCFVSLVCPTAGCRGEDCTRTTEFSDLVPWATRWQSFVAADDKLVTLAVGQNLDGRLEVFGAAGDDTLWHNWQTAPNNGWSGWHRFLATDDKLVTLAIGRNQDGRLEVFGTARDETVWHNWQTSPNNGWSGWHRFLAADDKLVTLAVGQNLDGRLEVFGVAKDETVWHNWQTAPNNGWSGWHRFLAADDKLVTLAVGQNLDGRLEVFGVAKDETVWHNWQTAPNNGWSGWQRFQASDDKLVTLAVGKNLDGRLEVFGVARDETVWHNWQTAPNNGWSGWQPFLSGDDKLVTLAVGLNVDGRLEVFGAARDESLWHNWQTAPNDGWTGWERFSVPEDRLITLVVGRNQDGRLEVFGAARDETLWHTWQTIPANAWNL